MRELAHLWFLANMYYVTCGMLFRVFEVVTNLWLWHIASGCLMEVLSSSLAKSIRTLCLRILGLARSEQCEIRWWFEYFLKFLLKWTEQIICGWILANGHNHFSLLYSPIRSSCGKDWLLITSTAHLAATTCWMASILIRPHPLPWLPVLVWCKLTRTPNNHWKN